MSSSAENNLLSRRALLYRLVAGAAGLSLFSPRFAGALQVKVTPPPFPFKLGLQSYSLRKFPLDEALEKTRALGLKWWEGWPGHLPITSDAAKLAGYKETLKAHDIRMISYGVLDFSTDEADARTKFQFAKSMGIETITAAPKPDALPLLDKLTQEYAINIGIHNHGPDDAQWGDWQKILAAVQGLNPRIGACNDTGHYLRADKNPITAAVQFGKRLFSVHLKTIELGPNGAKPFVPIGTTGALLDCVQLLRFLKEQKYRGILAIEEEEQPDNPTPLISKSIDAMKRYINTVNTVTLKSD